MYLFSQNAREQLAKNLKRDGYLGTSHIEFDYRFQDWQGWRKGYFQEITVKGMDAILPDGLLSAMGDFTLCALADGSITPTSEGYHISMKKVGIFILDLFNFDGDQAMEYWSCVHKSFQGLDPDEAVYLYNSDFRAFQKKIKMGNNFLVLSMPKVIDDFEGYEYDIKI